MWDQYRKTFKGIQLVILMVTACVYLFIGRNWLQAGVVFAVMQISAVIGALWAARLSAIIRRRTQALPLRVRG